MTYSAQAVQGSPPVSFPNTKIGAVARPLYSRAQSGVCTGGTKPLVFDIFVSHLPEGVWFAQSPSIPGLIIEGESYDEVRNEVRIWAKHLLTETKILRRDKEYTLIFHDLSKSYFVLA